MSSTSILPETNVSAARRGAGVGRDGNLGAQKCAGTICAAEALFRHRMFRLACAQTRSGPSTVGSILIRCGAGLVLAHAIGQTA